MANYIQTSRTNYFKVKPELEEQFDNFVSKFDLEVVRQGELYGLLFSDGVPSEVYVEDDDSYEIDFMVELSQFLADDEVAIAISVGSEKMRFVGGFAEAVNNKGETRFIALNSIYEIAKELGKNVTPAEY